MSDINTEAWPADAQRLRLGPIEIDLRYRSIHRAGMSHEVNPRSFAVLLLFLREPRVLHSRNEIFRKLWSGVVVEDSNLTSSIWMLRRALGGEAKQWIRTISRQGYVFDPPAQLKVEVIVLDADTDPTKSDGADLESESPAVFAPASIIPAAESIEPEAPHRPASKPQYAGSRVVAAGLLTLIIAVFAYWNGASSAPAPKRVVLVMSADAHLVDAERWPNVLLYHWIDWQLRSIADVVVREPGEATVGSAETVVLLAVNPGTIEHDWQISAQFRGQSQPADIAVRSDTAGLVAAISEVSQDSINRLVGHRRGTLPALSLDVKSAELLANAMRAESSRRWSEAVRAYRAVLEADPEQGFARFRLSRSLAQLGQNGAARAEMTTAHVWISTLPELLRDPMLADEHLIRKDYPDAALAYANLQQRAGEQAGYKVGEAMALRLAGRSSEAAERLTGAVPLAPPLALPWLLERAQIELGNRDFSESKLSAQLALDLALKSGAKHDAARARLLMVDNGFSSGGVPPAPLIEAAEADFLAVDDRLGVLRARYLGELARGNGSMPPRALDALLAEARSAGNVAVEIDALRRTWIAHYRAGDLPEVHRRAAQAAAVAESANDPVEARRIDINLLHVDLLSLDFASADRRLERLRAGPQQGTLAYAVGLYAARLHYMRGQFALANAALDQAESALRGKTGSPPGNVASLDCLRATIFVAQGQPVEARNRYRRCRAARNSAFEQFADLGEADLAIQAGDLDVAQRLLAGVHAQTGTGAALPERWALINEIAPIWMRAGQREVARQLIEGIKTDVQTSGFRMLEASLRISHAELAIADGRTDEAAADLLVVNAILPADYWFEQRRARTVSALVTQARGNVAQAAAELEELHADTREHGDVLGELLVHSLIDANPLAKPCANDRHLQLLASSGMRGASDRWMLDSSTQAIRQPDTEVTSLSGN